MSDMKLPEKHETFRLSTVIPSDEQGVLGRTL